MKKWICVCLALALLVGMLAGCGGGSSTEGKKSVVVTVFPIYDWVMKLLGDCADDWEVTFLLDNGVDLHSYQPTAGDLVKITSCDLFLYVGGSSDAWVEDALKGQVNPDLKAVSLMALLGADAKEEELVEGMEAEEEEEEGAPELDEHVWLSLKNAGRFVSAIADALAAIDPAHASYYQANRTSYSSQLSELDARYAEEVRNGVRTTLLFGDRFPFRYLTEDYGLTYYAAFVGCSAESEASFETVVFLAGKVDELSLPVVLTLEGGSRALAQTIIDNTADQSAQIVTMNSMQSTTRADADAGQTYLGLMEANLEALKIALN